MTSVATAPAPVTTASAVSRWSASSWVFFRSGGTARPLAGGGTLGGSQAGARLGYRLNDDPARPVSLSIRFYSPLREARQAEAALGIEWTPARAVPVTILAERRQALAKGGRSAWAVMAYGGISERPVHGPLQLDAYVQAGVVGVRRRDAFAEGAAALSMPLDDSGRLKIGAGGWAAAQPGVSRVDVGPQLSYTLPVEGRAMRISADWRFRVAGGASPASGPSLTLSTAF